MNKQNRPREFNKNINITKYRPNIQPQMIAVYLVYNKVILIAKYAANDEYDLIFMPRMILGIWTVLFIP